MENQYDSTAETLVHIKKVSKYLGESAAELIKRGSVHDDSKLVSPEKEAFDRMTPILAKLTYGTPEYQESLNQLEGALNHHYENNSHHPQHYPNGINGMDLFDLIEMFCDWKAASERTNDGNIYKSIYHNRNRFKMTDQLAEIFINTAKKLGY